MQIFFICGKPRMLFKALISGAYAYPCQVFDIKMQIIVVISEYASCLLRRMGGKSDKNMLAIINIL